MGFKLGPDGKPLEYDTSFSQSTDDEKTVYQPSKEPGTQPMFNTLDDGDNGNINLFDNQQSIPGKRPDKMEIAQEPPTAPNFAGTQDLFQHQTPQSNSTQESQSTINEEKTQFDFGNNTESSGHEFICGWFVIIEGPGKGQAVTIPPGQSIVSRSPSERICFNFGDTSITSGNQMIVMYDDEENDFIVAPGTGKNFNRINNQVLASQTILNHGDIIKIGKTRVRFVAFCDSDFKWN